jgi:hypothetical protein
MASAPLSDDIAFVVARLVDDAQAESWREPSHSTLEFLIKRAGLSEGDPNSQGQSVGKRKRLLATLSWSLEHSRSAGEDLVASVISSLRAHGGFRPTSPNYVGEQPIQDAGTAFRSEGYELSLDGSLGPIVLDNLSGAALTDALEAYVRRAKRGAADAALLTGTSKDLLEATAAHVVVSRYGHDPGKANFPTLLEWAFTSLRMATPKDPVLPDELANRRFERAMFELACATNNLRNKQGTGHGRPWLPWVTDSQARSAVELMGCIAERLLSALRDGG